MINHDPVQTVGNRDDTGLFRHKPGLHWDSIGGNRDAYVANRLKERGHGSPPFAPVASRFTPVPSRITLVAVIFNTGKLRGRTGMLPGLTVVKPEHTGMHRDDTMVEQGTRPGLHLGNTVTMRT